MAILLSHPHAAAVANATAIALDRHRMLAAYFTGIAGVAGHRSGRLLELLARRAPVAHNRLLDGLDPAKLRSLPLTELAARAVGRTLERALGARVTPGEALFLAHDARVAAAHWPATTRAVYAYEDGARRTFHRAAKRGLARIWDLPAVHYATVETLWREEAARWPGAMGAHPRLEPPWKRRLKDDELAHATHIFVASSFTRASVARVASVPITVAPYGFPTASFPARSAAPRGPFTVLAVGTQDLRKGTPYLLEAWKRAAIKDARLKIIGSMNLSPSFLARYRDHFEHVSPVPRAKLAAEYCAADVLVFPTLGDGFGLVLQEAMCCGTPVITTRCGGGPECITDGVDGWIVPERDIDALVDRLRLAARDRNATFAMGVRARARAERYTWTEAGDALCAALAPLLR